MKLTYEANGDHPKDDGYLILDQDRDGEQIGIIDKLEDAQTICAGPEIRRAALTLRKASAELIYAIASDMDISHSRWRKQRDALLAGLHGVDVVLPPDDQDERKTT